MKYVLFILIVFTAFSFTNDQARLESFNAYLSHGKVMLDWTVSGNSTADRFEIENGINVKSLSTVAIVFASEKAGKDQYSFYEKVNIQKPVYRVKLINKDKKTEYSKPLYVKEN